MDDRECDSIRSPAPGKRQVQSGFTLLELIITLAISAILIGLAVPSLQSFMGDSAVTATSNEFVHSLQTARSEAIKRAGPVGLCPSAVPLADAPVCSDTSYARGWIVFFDANGNGSRELAEDIVLQAAERSAAFTFVADKAFAQRVYFGGAGTSINPAGVPLSGVINISYAAGAELRTIRVAANGRITTLAPKSLVTP